MDDGRLKFKAWIVNKWLVEQIHYSNQYRDQLLTALHDSNCDNTARATSAQADCEPEHTVATVVSPPDRGPPDTYNTVQPLSGRGDDDDA